MNKRTEEESSSYAIQLSLFPAHGFGILLAGGELAFDHWEGRPFIAPDRKTAGWVKWTQVPRYLQPRVVPVEIHNEDDETPTYVIGE